MYPKRVRIRLTKTEELDRYQDFFRPARRAPKSTHRLHAVPKVVVASKARTARQDWYCNGVATGVLEIEEFSVRCQ